MMNRRQYLKYGIAGASGLLLGDAVASEPEYLWNFDYLSTPYSWRYNRLKLNDNHELVADTTSKKVPAYYVMGKYNSSYSNSVFGRYLFAGKDKSFYTDSNKPNIDYFKKSFSEYKQQEADYWNEVHRSGSGIPKWPVNANDDVMVSIDYYFAIQVDKDKWRVITDECVLTDTISHTTAWDRNNEFWKPLFRRTI